MNLAFVSYEYLPDTGGGGIATSTSNTAQMLRRRGHHVEVFAGSHTRSGTTEEDGVVVHRFNVDPHGSGARAALADAVVDRFGERHRAVGFDLVEGPEYGADARVVRASFPDIPLCVKLRTPASVISLINYGYLSLQSKARFIAGGLIRGRVPRPYWRYDPSKDEERTHTLDADGVIAPSAEIRDRLVDLWGLDRNRIWVAPHPFLPSPDLLDVPVGGDTGRVTFLGRLEVRKGVMELAEAIPTVLDRVPNARFQFVGRSLPHPDGGDIRSMLKRRLASYLDRVKFVDAVPYEEVPALFAESDVCVFPSVWESFGFVCLEAMAAARPVVATVGTGMEDMLDGGVYGRMVPPKTPQAIADAVVELLSDSSERIRLGAAARQRVLDAYNYDVVGARQEEVYREIIRRTYERPTSTEPTSAR